MNKIAKVFRGFKPKEQEAVLLFILLNILIAAITITTINNKAEQIKQRITQINNQYQKSLKLYNKIKSSQSKRRVFNEDILLLVQRLQKNPQLNKKIVSVSSMSDGAAIKIKAKLINLRQLVEILRVIEGYSNIQIKNYSLRKSFTSNKLLDFDFTVVKVQ